MADMNKLKDKYTQNASGAGQRLVDGYMSATGKVAAATSDAAQKNYIAAVTDPKVQARRVNNLKKLTDDDLNRAMAAKGSQNYSAGITAGVDKWAKNAEPFISEAERIAASLPARSRDVAANVANRVTPVAVGLRKKKESMG